MLLNEICGKRIINSLSARYEGVLTGGIITRDLKEIKAFKINVSEISESGLREEKTAYRAPSCILSFKDALVTEELKIIERPSEELCMDAPLGTPVFNLSGIMYGYLIDVFFNKAFLVTRLIYDRPFGINKIISVSNQVIVAKATLRKVLPTDPNSRLRHEKNKNSKSPLAKRSSEAQEKDNGRLEDKSAAANGKERKANLSGDPRKKSLSAAYSPAEIINVSNKAGSKTTAYHMTETLQAVRSPSNIAYRIIKQAVATTPAQADRKFYSPHSDASGKPSAAKNGETPFGDADFNYRHISEFLTADAYRQSQEDSALPAFAHDCFSVSKTHEDKAEKRQTPLYSVKYPQRIIGDYGFLLGRTVGDDIRNIKNQIIIPRGTVISDKTVETSGAYGKLVELTFSSITTQNSGY
jgi:hypothetical protein